MFGRLTAPTVTDPLAAVSCPAGTVAPGASVICTANYAVTQANLDAGQVVNTASATITVGGVTATGSDTKTVTATRTTGLTLDKRLATASPTSFSATGVTLSYAYVLTNTGNVTLNTVAVADNKTTVSCPATTIAPLAVLTCTSTYVTTQADLNTGNVTNTASASAKAAGTEAVVNANGDVQGMPAVQSPALFLDKTAPVLTAAQFVVGGTATNNYSVQNTGNVQIAGPINITDDKAGTFQCAAGPIVPGATVNCTRAYVLKPADVLAGAVVNVATATAGTVTSNKDSATIAPTLTPGVTLVKSANLANVSATTDLITCTFAVTNSGNTQILKSAQVITVTDPKISTVDCSAQPATLAPGASFNCTGTYPAGSLKLYLCRQSGTAQHRAGPGGGRGMQRELSGQTGRYRCAEPDQYRRRARLRSPRGHDHGQRYRRASAGRSGTLGRCYQGNFTATRPGRRLFHRQPAGNLRRHRAQHRQHHAEFHQCHR